MMVRLAPVLVRYRRAVIGAWLAFLALAIVVGPLRRFHDRWGLSEPATLDTDDLGGPDAEADVTDHGVMTPRLADLAR